MAPIKIVLIDDNPDDRMLVSRELKKEYDELEIIQISNASGLANVLDRGNFDLIITDYQLGWTNGLKIFHMVKLRFPNCPVIMFTGTGNEEIAVEAIKAGLNDYVIKSANHFARLIIAVRSVLELAFQKKAIHDLETNYQTLFNRIPIGLYRSNEVNQLLDVNAALIEMLQFPDRETLLKTPTTELYIDPVDQLEWRKQISEKGIVNNFICKFRRFDGSAIWGEENTIVRLNAKGEPEFFEGSLVDITKRKIAEESLLESETNYREMFNYANEAIFVQDVHSGRIIDSNKKTIELFGFKDDLLRQFSAADLCITDPPYDSQRLNNYFSKAIEGQLQLFEWKMKDKDGKIFWTEISLKKMFLGRKERLLFQIRNINERKMIEEENERILAQLIQAQKMEALAHLVSGITHDFNNFLTTIQGYADLAMLDIDSPPELKTHLENVLFATDRASTLVRQLLLFSVKQTPGLTEINLNGIIEDMLEIINRTIGENIQVQTDLDSELKSILSDRGTIDQVLFNLIINSRDAMPNGGKILIKTRNVTHDNRHSGILDESRRSNYVHLSIQDSGIGMPADVLSRIFNPFFTTKESGKGSGLGLSIVEQIVKQNGGWINVTSQPNIGTTFDLYFPSMTTVIHSTSSGKESLSGDEEYILVVEDDRHIQQMIVRALLSSKYQAVGAPDAEKAMDLLTQSNINFYAALVDLVLPDQSGIDLAEELSKIYPALKIVIMSGHAGDKKISTRIQDNHYDFLPKPFTINELLSVLKRR